MHADNTSCTGRAGAAATATAAVRPVDVRTVVLSKTLVQLPQQHTRDATCTPEAAAAAREPRMLLAPIDRAHMLLSYRAAQTSSSQPPPSQDGQQARRAHCCHDALSASNTCIATVCLHDDDDKDTCATVVQPVTGLPFDSFDGWVRDYTAAHMRRQARALHTLWRSRVRRCASCQADSHDTSSSESSWHKAHHTDDKNDDGDEDEAFARRFAERVGHRLLVSDAVRHAIWAVHVDGACARRVRAVAPATFYDDTDSNAATDADVVAAPLLGGVAAGFVDGAFAVARFCRPTALCWRIDTDVDADVRHAHIAATTTTHYNSNSNNNNNNDNNNKSVKEQGGAGGGAGDDDDGSHGDVKGDNDCCAAHALPPRRHACSLPTSTTSSSLSSSSCDVLFISDSGNHAIRYANFRTRLVRTIAGLDGAPGYRDGACVSSALHGATALAWCATGLLFADAANGALRIITGIAHARATRQTTTTTATTTRTSTTAAEDECTRAAQSPRTGVPRVWTVAGGGSNSSISSSSATTATLAVGTHDHHTGCRRSVAASSRYVDSAVPQRAVLGYPADIAIVEHATADGGAAAVVFVDAVCNAVRVLDAAGVRTLVGLHEYSVSNDDDGDGSRVRMHDVNTCAHDSAHRRGCAAFAALHCPLQLLACALVVERRDVATRTRRALPPSSSPQQQQEQQQQQQEQREEEQQSAAPSHADDVGAVTRCDTAHEQHIVRNCSSGSSLLLSSSLAFVVVSARAACASLLMPVAQASLRTATCTHGAVTLTSPPLVNTEADDDDNNSSSSSSSSGSSSSGSSVCEDGGGGDNDTAHSAPATAPATATAQHRHCRHRRTALDALLRIGRVGDGKRVLCEAGGLSVQRVVLPCADDGNGEDDDDDTAAVRYTRLQLPWVLPPAAVAQTGACLTRLYCHVSGKEHTRKRDTHATTTTTAAAVVAPVAAAPPSSLLSRATPRQPTYAAQYTALSPRAQRKRASVCRDDMHELNNSSTTRAAATARALRTRSAAMSPPLLPRALSAHQLMRRGRSRVALDTTAAVASAAAAAAATATRSPHAHASSTSHSPVKTSNDSSDLGNDDDDAHALVARTHSARRTASTAAATQCYDAAVCALFDVYAFFAQRTSELQPVYAAHGGKRNDNNDNNNDMHSCRGHGKSHALSTALSHSTLSPPRRTHATCATSLLHVVTHSMSLLSLYRFLYHTSYLADVVAVAVREATATAAVAATCVHVRGGAKGGHDDDGHSVLCRTRDGNNSKDGSSRVTWSSTPAMQRLARSTSGLLLPVAPHDDRAYVEQLHRCSQRIHGYHAAAPMSFAYFRRLLLLLTLMEQTARQTLRQQQQQEQQQQQGDKEHDSHGNVEHDAHKGSRTWTSLLHAVPLPETLTEQQRIDAYTAAYTRAVAHVPGLRQHLCKQRKQQQQRQQGQREHAQQEAVTLSSVSSLSRSELSRAAGEANNTDVTAAAMTSRAVAAAAPLCTPPLSPIARRVAAPLTSVNTASNNNSSSSNSNDSSSAHNVRDTNADAHSGTHNWLDAPPPRAPPHASLSSPPSSSSMSAAAATSVAAASATRADVRDAVDALLCLLVRNEAVLQQLFDAYSEPVHVRSSPHYTPPRDVAALATRTRARSGSRSSPPTSQATAAAAAPQDMLWQLTQLYATDAQSSAATTAHATCNNSNNNSSTMAAVTMHTLPRRNAAMTLRVVRYRAFVELCRVTDVYPSLLSLLQLQRVYVDALCDPLLDLTRPPHDKCAGGSVEVVNAPRTPAAATAVRAGGAHTPMQAARHAPPQPWSPPPSSSSSATSPSASSLLSLLIQQQQQQQQRGAATATARPIHGSVNTSPASCRSSVQDTDEHVRRVCHASTSKHRSDGAGAWHARHGLSVRDALLTQSGLTYLAFVEAFVRLALTAFTLDAATAGNAANAFPTAAAKVDALMRYVNQQIRLGRVAERMHASGSSRASSRHGVGSVHAATAAAGVGGGGGGALHTSFPLRADLLFRTSVDEHRARRRQ